MNSKCLTLCGWTYARGSVGRDMWLSDRGGDIFSGAADNCLPRIGDRDLYAWSS